MGKVRQGLFLKFENVMRGGLLKPTETKKELKTIIGAFHNQVDDEGVVVRVMPIIHVHF